MKGIGALILAFLVAMIIMPLYIFFLNSTSNPILLIGLNIIISMLILLGCISLFEMLHLYRKARMGKATHDEIEIMKADLVYVLIGYILSLWTYLIPLETYPDKLIGYLNHSIAILYMTIIPIMKIIEDIEIISH